MNPWLLIPIKSFEAGKSRLRGALDDDDRYALNAFFLRRTLETAVQFPGIARTAVMSDCKHVLQTAARWGARTIHQKAGGGLNCAAREGVD